jgi:hypothetical protein
MSGTYQFEKFAGNGITKAIANWVDTIMSDLTFSQQDRLWSQMKASPTLWGLLWPTVSQRIWGS